MTNQDIKLNAWDLNYESQIAVQGEVNSRTLTVTLIDKTGTTSYISNAESVDRPIDLTGVTARLYVFKLDGTKTFSDGTITDMENGKVDFILPAQATTYVGKNPCQILLTKADNSALKITGLTLDVQESDLEGAIESTDDFSALVVALNSISASAIAANTAVTNANAAVLNANNAAINANEKADFANTAATTANTSASNADAKTSLAITATANANIATTAANTAATNADAAAVRANGISTEVEQAVQGVTGPLIDGRLSAQKNVANGIMGIGSDGNSNNTEFVNLKSGLSSHITDLSEHYIVTKNLFDKSSAITGYYVSYLGGGFTANVDYCRSRFIEIIQSTQYTINWFDQIV